MHQPLGVFFRLVFSSFPSSCLFKGPLTSFWFSAVLSCECSASLVISSPCDSLPQSLLSSLLPELARSHLAELRRQRSLFPRFLFNEALNAVLHLSELSDLLDVTLDSSKIVKLALTWVATRVRASRCLLLHVCLIHGKEQPRQGAYKRKA